VSQPQILILHPNPAVHEKYATLGCASCFNGARFYSLSLGLRKDFSDFIDEINLKYGHSVDWWATELANGRDSIANHLFEDVCYVFYALALIAEQVPIHEIVCHSSALAKTLKKIPEVEKNKISVQTSGASFFRRRFPIAVGTFRYIQNVLKLAFIKWPVAFLPVASSEPVKVLDLFIFPDSVSKNKIQSRQWGDALSRLTKNGWALFPTEVNFSSTQKYGTSLNAVSDVRFLLKERLLKLCDYIWAGLHPFRLLFSRPHFSKFKNISLSPLLKSYVFSSSIEGQNQSLWDYLALQRLKKSGYQILHHLDWFENQRIDKIQQFALKSFFPECKRSAYLVPIASEFALHYQPSIGDFRLGVIPQSIYVPGRAWVSWVKESCPQLHVDTAPAVSHPETLLDDKKTWSSNLPTVLFCLALDKYVADELMQVAIKLLSDKPNPFQVAIRPHPVMSASTLEKLKAVSKKYGMLWLPAEEIQAHALIQSKSIISIVASSSSVVIDAVIAGQPAIVLGSRTGLTHNPACFKPLNEGAHVAFDPKEIKSQILQNIPLFGKERQTPAQKSHIYEPVTDLKVDAWLKMIEENTSNF